MPDWAVIVIAAFGGGLAGAVLQPLVLHALERLRREEEIRRRREGHLRRMLESRIVMAMALVHGSWQVIMRQDEGPAMTWSEKMELLAPPASGPVWEPERIKDSSLRQKAESYADAASALFRALLPTTADAKKVDDLVNQLEALRREIVLRMDELNWPEVQD